MRDIHPDFLYYLKYKDQKLMDLYCDVRAYLLELYPNSNELLYRTHALTSVYTLSEKLSDAFCMIPIYTNHLNLGFNKGTLLDDKNNLLQGTGKLIRHIPIEKPEDYRNTHVKQLVQSAIDFSLNDMKTTAKCNGLTFSKIKRK